jgi:pimeloyl-ACP methyl ester carboxylesterase
MTASITTKTKSADGTTIAFDRLGSGAPIVLVHPAYGHRQFDPPMAELARQLSARLTVYTYDRRGRGESSDTAPYAVEREIEDLAAVLDEAGGSASVYGMSSGAVLALEAAARGLKIARLALYEPPFIVDQSRPPYPEDYVDHLAGLIASGRRGDAAAYAMANAGVPAPVVEQMRSQPFWGAFEAVAHTLVYDGAVMGETQRGRPLPARFQKVEQPTLVMVASKAPDWARAAADALVAALPEGTLETLEGEFHSVDPEVVGPIVAGFMSR